MQKNLVNKQPTMLVPGKSLSQFNLISGVIEREFKMNPCTLLLNTTSSLCVMRKIYITFTHNRVRMLGTVGGNNSPLLSQEHSSLVLFTFY